MNVGSSRRVAPWVVVFLAAGAAGCMSCATEKPRPVRSKEHPVLLRSEKPQNGPCKVTAVPNHLFIPGYVPEKPDDVVIWSYRHKSTTIKFDPSTPAIPDPKCIDADGECTLVLPKNLPPRTPLKYTVTGKHDDHCDFEPNDPWIEVDR